MREPAPDYSASQYERPNQPWVCGLTDQGSPCPAGPTAHGHCPALAECAPLRDGDRWICNRSALRGGRCDDGPTPEGTCGRMHKCHPMRSLRSKRGRFITACMVLTVGGILIGLSTDWRDRVIKPGPLAQQHAQLLERQGGEPNCAACHTAATQNVGGWTASLVFTRDDLPTQSQLCMNCHRKTISTELAVTAHNLPPSVLRQITESRATTSGQSRAGDNSLPRALDAKQLACAACHREHHGAQAELTAISDAACQSCHQQRYNSFAEDHPDFGNWPYERRTRIAFNHASHRGKHFVEKKQAFDCRKCHVSDATGNVQKLASYEAACASCHDEKIATSVARGVPMFIVPTLDVAVLKKAGHDIGPWPDSATGDFDGRLPPVMKLLLAADPDAEHAMTVLGTDFDFQDVDPDDPIQLAACAKLAAAIKSMFADVSQRGPVAVGERLQRALAPYPIPPEVSGLIAGLSVDTVRGVSNWLPGIDIGKGEWPQQTQTHDPAKQGPAYTAAGSWVRDNATLSIRYRPAAHADPVLTSWLELLAATPQLALRSPLALAMFKELSKPTAPGLCASCHSVEQTGEGALAINWRAYNRAAERRSFTKFSHGPHLVLPQLADCAKCHSIDDAVGSATPYAHLNPHHFASEFKPLTKQQCAECHTRASAGDSCQSCHNYHVEGSGVRGQGSDSITGLNPKP